MLPSPYSLMVASLSLRTFEHVRRFGLHPVRRLHRLQRSFELRIVGALLLHLQPVQLGQQFDLALLLVEVELIVVDVRNQLLWIELFLLHAVRDVSSLIDRRQKRRVPQRRSHGRRNFRAEHHERGQISVFRSQPVRDPRTDRRPSRLDMADIHHQQRGFMIRNIRVHGADDAHIVHALAQHREDLADFNTALSVFLEREGRLHQVPGFALMLRNLAGQRLAIVLFQHRLGIETVHLR